MKQAVHFEERPYKSEKKEEGIEIQTPFDPWGRPKFFIYGQLVEFGEHGQRGNLLDLAFFDHKVVVLDEEGKKVETSAFGIKNPSPLVLFREGEWKRVRTVTSGGRYPNIEEDPEGPLVVPKYAGFSYLWTCKAYRFRDIAWKEEEKE